MLRKALGELRRVGRRKRTATLVGIVLLLLGVMTVAVVLAADPSVDGDIGNDPAWQSSDVVRTDDNEGDISDQYDIEDVYMRSSDDNVTFFGGFEVYTDSIMVNNLASMSFGFDTDANSATGGSVDSGVCPNIGAEYRHDYLDFAGTVYQGLYQWNGTDWDSAASTLGDHDPEYEIALAYQAIGLTETKCISVAVYFENRASDPDDYVCDMTWCYTDGVTVVDLSSFAASSEGSDSRVIQPGMWALLGLGLAFVAAGGLVLWRGWGLAS